MARTLKVGATYPAVQGMASDSTGAALDLSTASALEFIAIGPTHTISGVATPIHPAIADPDGIHFWNWQYVLVAGDTDIAGTYNVYLKVTWAAGQIEYFPDDGSETLTIETVN